MQLTLHATRRTPHSFPHFVQVISAWSVKTRRAPFWHYRDARVYAYNTTTMPVNGYTSRPLPTPIIGGILMCATLKNISRDDTSSAGRRRGPAAFGNDINRYVHTQLQCPGGGNGNSPGRCLLATYETPLSLSDRIRWSSWTQRAGMTGLRGNGEVPLHPGTTKSHPLNRNPDIKYMSPTVRERNQSRPARSGNPTLID